MTMDTTMTKGNVMCSEDNENVPNGCMNAIVSVLAIIAMLILLAGTSSCTTSKNVCGVTTADVDSLEMFMRDSMAVTVKDSSAVSMSVVAEHKDTTTIVTTEDGEETITEHIVQTTDAQGNTTTTTDRTTKRKTNMTQTQTSAEWQRRQEEQLALHLSYLDSLRQSMLTYRNYHRTDSADVKETVAEPRKDPWWKRIIDFISTVAQGTVLLFWLSVGLYVSYCAFKKEG